MKKLLMLPLMLLLLNCSKDDSSECDKINEFYNKQQAQILKQTNPDKNSLKTLEEERQLKLKQSGCN